VPYNPTVQRTGGFIAGGAIAGVPLGGVVALALIQRGILAKGTPEAREGLAKGMAIGGVVWTLLGLSVPAPPGAVAPASGGPAAPVVVQPSGVGVLAGGGVLVNAAAGTGELAASLDTSSGSNPQEGTDEGATPEKTHRHHLLPRQFRNFFEQKEIDIDKYCVEVPERQHLRGIHGNGDETGPGGWNDRWQEWIDQNKKANREDIFQFMQEMMGEYGMSDLPIVDYR
jgi:hypothetical protein